MKTLSSQSEPGLMIFLWSSVKITVIKNDIFIGNKNKNLIKKEKLKNMTNKDRDGQFNRILAIQFVQQIALLVISPDAGIQKIESEHTASAF